MSVNFLQHLLKVFACLLLDSSYCLKHCYDSFSSSRTLNITYEPIVSYMRRLKSPKHELFRLLNGLIKYFIRKSL